MPALSGEVVASTRFLSVIHSPASRFTSASVIPGRSLVMASRSYSMLVDGSDWRNADTYDSAYTFELVFSRSA